MIKIDDPPANVDHAIYYSNCLTCNDPTNTILNIVTTANKVEAMVLANDHVRENGQGHQICITYSVS